MVRLPNVWESFLAPHLDIPEFYDNLESFLQPFNKVMPDHSLIFNVFNYMSPLQVRCVLYGEDPYPRPASANGVAFWDAEIKSWEDKTNGNSLKNILKALLVYRGWASYGNSIAECRKIALEKDLPAPPELFRSWLEQGVLLINTSMTFSNKEDKNEHFAFWRPFHLALIRALNGRKDSPFYILWGNKARRWESFIRESNQDDSRVIIQGHPTFIHQFLDACAPGYSPFGDLAGKTGIRWI